MEQSATGGSDGRDLALLRFKGLGAGDDGSKTDPGRIRFVGYVRPGVEESPGIRLAGSVSQSSADWGFTFACLRSGALCSMVGGRTAEGSRFERGNQNCARGRQSRIRAAVQPDLYRLC